MNIKRFTAPTSREALAKARMAFGDGTLILSNRPTANGVEVVATAEDTLSALDGSAGASSNPPLQAPTPARSAPQRASQTAAASTLGRNAVEEDTEQLAMSTLSFQDYVRERMLRRRHEALNGPAEPQTLSERSRDQEPERERMPAPAVVRHNPLRSIPMDIPPEPPRRRQEAASAHLAQSNNNQQSVMNELHAMRELIEDRFNTMAWLGQARQNPIQSNLMLKMIRAGYSPSL
ncbi:MAG: flagellar biosynthesis protein FlhF, partial [Betaproteobacteria bacterium]